MDNETGDLITELKQSGYPQTIPPASERTIKTVVLYSPSMDSCMSFQLAFESRYNILTTTDSEMLMTLVKTSEPDLVIVDAFPTLKMRKYFAMMKHESPRLRILLFLSFRFYDQAALSSLYLVIDAVSSAPMTLAELQKRIISLLHE